MTPHGPLAGDVTLAVVGAGAPFARVPRPTARRLRPARHPVSVAPWPRGWTLPSPPSASARPVRVDPPVEDAPPHRRAGARRIEPEHRRSTVEALAANRSAAPPPPAQACRRRPAGRVRPRIGYRAGRPASRTRPAGVDHASAIGPAVPPVAPGRPESTTHRLSGRPSRQSHPAGRSRPRIGYRAGRPASRTRRCPSTELKRIGRACPRPSATHTCAPPPLSPVARRRSVAPGRTSPAHALVPSHATRQQGTAIHRPHRTHLSIVVAPHHRARAYLSTPIHTTTSTSALTIVCIDMSTTSSNL